MDRIFVIGTLLWSREDDFYLETDDGSCWMLDLPWLMTDEADGLLHMRVRVEGSRIGAATVAISAIVEAE